jgi:hypothetical protein
MTFDDAIRRAPGRLLLAAPVHAARLRLEGWTALSMVRGDDPDVAAYLRIEQREREGAG